MSAAKHIIIYENSGELFKLFLFSDALDALLDQLNRAGVKYLKKEVYDDSKTELIIHIDDLANNIVAELHHHTKPVRNGTQ